MQDNASSRSFYDNSAAVNLILIHSGVGPFCHFIPFPSFCGGILTHDRALRSGSSLRRWAKEGTLPRRAEQQAHRTLPRQHCGAGAQPSGTYACCSSPLPAQWAIGKTMRALRTRVPPETERQSVGRQLIRRNGRARVAGRVTPRAGAHKTTCSSLTYSITMTSRWSTRARCAATWTSTTACTAAVRTHAHRGTHDTPHHRQHEQQRLGRQWCSHTV